MTLENLKKEKAILEIALSEINKKIQALMLENFTNETDLFVGKLVSYEGKLIQISKITLTDSSRWVMFKRVGKNGVAGIKEYNVYDLNKII